MIDIKIDAMKSDRHQPRSQLLNNSVSELDSFLKQIMNNGRYLIDNNIAKQFIKPLANEHKNSHLYGSNMIANVSTMNPTFISTCRQLKVSVYFDRLFGKIVRGCTHTACMLLMNMGLGINKY